MKKFLRVLTVFVVLAFFASSAFAGRPSPDYTNVIYQMARGTDGTEAPMIVVPVRNISCDPDSVTLVSGSAVAFSPASRDGISVVPCPLKGTFAGILVTDILTSDVGGTFDPTSRNWGYMCIKGYCFASMDTVDGVVGDTITNSQLQEGAMQGGISIDAAYTAGAHSRDVVGVLLQSTATAGSHYPVLLY